jgi:hypothetical protein
VQIVLATLDIHGRPVAFAAMALSLRQWMIVGVLVLGFLIAALAVASGGDKAPQIDTAAWCSNAVGLEGVRPLLEGDVDVATAESFDDARYAFYAVEVLAPFEIRSDIARLADFTFITSQAFATSDWPDAFEAARDNVDTVAVAESILAVDGELAACGVNFAG